MQKHIALYREKKTEKRIESLSRGTAQNITIYTREGKRYILAYTVSDDALRDIHTTRDSRKAHPYASWYVYNTHTHRLDTLVILRMSVRRERCNASAIYTTHYMPWRARAAGRKQRVYNSSSSAATTLVIHRNAGTFCCHGMPLSLLLFLSGAEYIHRFPASTDP